MTEKQRDEAIAKVRHIVEKEVNGRYEIELVKSLSTESFYFYLKADNIFYKLRFSQHDKKGISTCSKYQKKNVENYVRRCIQKLEIKKVRYLFCKIA